MVEKKAQELLDAPVGGLTEADQLALINEVLIKRQEELEEVQHNLTLAQAKITSEKAQWSQHQADLEREFRLKVAQIEEQWAMKLQEVEQMQREQQQSLRNQKDMESEAERRIEEISQQKQSLADLSKERLEIEFLRRQVEERSNHVESRWSASQEALTKGQDALSRSQKTLEEVELRNLRLNELETSIRQREEQVLLKEKQLELAGQELDRRLAEYTKVQKEGELNPSLETFKEESKLVEAPKSSSQPVLPPIPAKEGENAQSVG